MGNLPADLGLTVIDDLPEMIGVGEGEKGFLFSVYFSIYITSFILIALEDEDYGLITLEATTDQADPLSS